MSLLSRLFGGAAKPQSKPEDHKGFAIIPEPIREGGQWRVSARIEKEVAGVRKSHLLVRADTFGNEDEAVQASVRKAIQVIDEQGEGLFG
jgi:hypothetical protein